MVDHPRPHRSQARFLSMWGRTRVPQCRPSMALTVADPLFTFRLVCWDLLGSKSLLMLTVLILPKAVFGWLSVSLPCKDQARSLERDGIIQWL